VKDVSKIYAMCKYYAGDVAMSITTDADRCSAAMASKECPVEKMMRDAKILQIYEDQIQLVSPETARNTLPTNGGTLTSP